ncbi:hypothetical protein Shyd_26090 [Streptomyces hydrogenans]|uniref:Uncharacterized protein n=1 Tax=Streptomyces hydrogenans TaxID=1873719 RepID=A0ABQ3P879_9ACTN|nr:hypothetical protein GCM10018784_34420 [Streptomyces hydrogenans]GHI21238.1 hypothetical protein Shyd_26090 [Streptomyces hydrogenans]
MSILLPNRYLKPADSLAVHAAELYRVMPPASSVGAGWASYRSLFGALPFERFVLTLDVLVGLGVVRLEGQQLVKVAEGAA